MDDATFAAKQDELLAELPEEFRGAVSFKAYHDGHGSGYHDVLIHVEELVEMLKEPLEKYTARLKGVLGSGKGLPPKAAAYATGTDHRRQVEAADIRRQKKKTVKDRRKLDALQVAEDESTPKDVTPEPIVRHHTRRRKDA